MRRWAFIAFLGATALSWYSHSYAQAPDKVHRVAVISFSASSIETFRSFVVPELAKLGFVEGRNLAVTMHIGLLEHMPEVAREALAANPDVIVATGDPAIRAVKATSSNVPVVMSFIGVDPVGLGLAQSLARPGGSVTGIWMLARDLDGKRLVLLHDAVPSARRIAILAMRPPVHTDTIKEMQRIGQGLGLEVHAYFANGPNDYPEAFASMRAARIEAVAILASPVFNRDAAVLSRMALGAGLPTVCEWASMSRDGCLIGHGPNLAALRLRVADYVARILRGTPPGDLPIELPAKFETAVNLRTAKQLGLILPQTITTRADEVIE